MKKYFIPISIAMLFLTSCLQENLEPSIIPDWPDTDPKPKVSRIKTVYSSGDTTSYSYDSLGRIIKSKYGDGGNSAYTYYQHSIDRKVYDNSGSLRLIETYDLNEKGLAIKSTRTDVPAGTYLYEYNSADQLIKFTSEIPNGKYEVFYTYKNGNLELADYKKDGVFIYAYHYSYYSDSPNGLDNKHYGQMYLGQDSKDLLKSWYGTGQNGNVTIQVAFDYTFDNQGRVATQTQVNGDKVDKWNYTY